MQFGDFVIYILLHFVSLRVYFVPFVVNFY